MVPKTHYARSGELSIAYQVLGEGPFDLVVVPGFTSNLDIAWEMPIGDLYRRLASFSRLIIFDKRGTGLSDRDCGIPSLEERIDDVHAVMTAAGSEKASILGFSEGSAMALMFAASYPARTRSLVLYGALCKFPGWVPRRLMAGPIGLTSTGEAVRRSLGLRRALVGIRASVNSGLATSAAARVRQRLRRSSR